MTASATQQYARLNLLPRRPAPGFDAEGWRLLFASGVFTSALQSQTAIRTAAMHLREMGAGGADRGLLFAAGAHYFGCLIPLVRHGSTEQIDFFLPSMRMGDMIGCLAITEAEGGASQAGVRTRVTTGAEGFRLTGTKLFVTNALQAGVALVLASEFPQRGSLGLSALLVPLSSPGISVLPLENHGLAGAPGGILQFDDVQLSPNCRLGNPGSGLAVMLSALQAERTAILAGFIGAAEFDLSRCFHHLKSRFAAVRDSSGEIPQVLRHRLAEIRCSLAAADAVLERGLTATETSDDSLMWPAIVKKCISETVVSVADRIHGIYAGNGWLNRNESASAVLDTRAVLAASGTSEVMLNMVWSQLSRTLVPIEHTCP
jgi:alkylation response protein AidB-like acyl-CoA dehydrogenase